MSSFNDFTFEPMSPRSYSRWRDSAIERRTQQQIEFMMMDAVDARRAASEFIASYFVEGELTTDRLLFNVQRSGETVGSSVIKLERNGARLNVVVVELELTATTEVTDVIGDLRNQLEQLARFLGASELHVGYFGRSAPLAQLARDGDYRIMSTQMLRQLEGTETSVSGPPITLQRMTAEEYLRFESELIVEYADSVARSGHMSPEQALDRSKVQVGELLAQGVDSDGHFLFVARSSTGPVGTLWLNEARDSIGPRGYVYDVKVDPSLQGQGFGRSTMLEAERFCRQRGHRALGLNVFGFNDVARRLYESLSYVVVNEAAGTTL